MHKVISISMVARGADDKIFVVEVFRGLHRKVELFGVVSLPSSRSLVCTGIRGQLVVHDNW